MATLSLDRPAFLRPVEITSSNNTVTVDSTPYGVPLGVYASVLHVVKELDDQLGGNYVWKIQPSSTTGELVTTISNISTMTVTWSDPDLATLLGFDGDPLSGSSSYTNDFQAGYTWVPNYVPAKRDAWQIDQRKAIKGSNTIDGNYIGTRSALDKYARDFDFVHEPKANVLRTHCGDSSAQGLTFEDFAIKARSEVPSVSSTVSVKGFYIVHRIDDADSTASWITSTGDGGIDIEFSSSPDLYVFAAFLKDKIRIGGYSLPTSYERMNLMFSVVTATAPSWAAV